MIRNIFKIAFRNLRSNKFFAIINVAGLSLGIACGILIFKIVIYHFSFDNFHENGNRIYRVVADFHYDGAIEHQQGVQQPFGQDFGRDFSFAEKIARVAVYHNALIILPGGRTSNKFDEENGVAFAEPSFFDIFNFPLLSGNPKTVLSETNSAVITQRIARKYFNTAEAIGKTISYSFSGRNIDFRITGILRDLPHNTDRKQELYLSYSNLKDRDPKLAREDNWGSVWSNMQCFMLLKQGVSKAKAESVLPAFAKKYLDPEDAKVTEFKLQPLADIHFNYGLRWLRG